MATPETYEDARLALQQFVATHFTGIPAANISWDDQNFTPPSDAPWMNVRIRHGDARRLSLGGPGNALWVRYGEMRLRIYHPDNEYGVVAVQLGDQAVSMFSAHPAPSGIRIDKVSMREGGSMGSAWFHVEVTVGFSWQVIA